MERIIVIWLLLFQKHWKTNSKWYKKSCVYEFYFKINIVIKYVNNWNFHHWIEKIIELFKNDNNKNSNNNNIEYVLHNLILNEKMFLSFVLMKQKIYVLKL